MDCRICGDGDTLVQCRKCDVYFCIEHRLPEDHGCPPVISDDPPDKHPNSPRSNKEVELIKEFEHDDWYYFADPPDWVVDAAESDGIPNSSPGEYRTKVYYGDTYVYKAVSRLHHGGVHVFTRMKK